MRSHFETPLTQIILIAMLLGICVSSAMPAIAAPLSLEMEYQTIDNVGTSWITVNLDGTYGNAIPVCTYVTQSIASPPALTRVRNITPQSFQLKIQEMVHNSSPVENTTPGTVHCVIAETGAHTLPDGRAFEAFSVLSDATTGKANGNWNVNDFEDVTSLVANSYISPVVMVGLISAIDPQPSAPMVSSCNPVDQFPFTDSNNSICIAKHTGQIPVSRADETMGVLIAESGTGSSNGIYASFFEGGDTIDGIGSNANTAYSVSEDFDSAIVSQVAGDGGHGSWATLVGADPLPLGSIRISLDEQIAVGPTNRKHTTETVAVFAFRDDRAPELAAAKTRQVWDPAALGLYALPSNDVAFTLSISNTGTGPVDPDTIFLVDQVPTEMTMYIGDFDESDGDSAPILFAETNSNLTFSYPSDVGFSSSATPPTSMAQCTHTPTTGYDTNIRYVCLNPKGAMGAGSPIPAIDFSYRARIN